MKLAICDDIGEAAYDTQRIAAKFLDLLKELQARRPDGTYDQTLQARYGLDLSDTTGEGFLSELAALKFQDDLERTAQRVLNDFRMGLLGQWALEWPEEISVEA